MISHCDNLRADPNARPEDYWSNTSGNDRKTLDNFCSAFLNGDTAFIEEIFNDYLWNTISIRDTAAQKERKENFYHGLLLGLLGFQDEWLVKSNAESGIGFSDILVEIRRNRIGIVIEMKYAEDGNLEKACQKALQQIKDKKYEARLKEDGMRNVMKYGIACYKKECKVEKGEA